MRSADRQRARLVWRAPSGETYERIMDEGETHIGRANDNDICLLNDKGASRHHAVISVRGTRAYVRDLSSLNGSFLNNERLDIGEYALRDRDVLVIGSTEFQVRLPRTDKFRKGTARARPPASSRVANSVTPGLRQHGPPRGNLNLGPTARGRIYQSGAVTIVELGGAIEVSCALLLQAALDAIVQDKPGGVVIDLAQVTGLDSAGLGVFVKLNQDCRQARTALRLAGARAAVAEVLRLTQTSHLFAQTDTVETALQTLLEEA